jgi:hypothetical protein
MFICFTVYSSWIPREVEPRGAAPISLLEKWRKATELPMEIFRR